MVFGRKAPNHKLDTVNIVERLRIMSIIPLVRLVAQNNINQMAVLLFVVVRRGYLLRFLQQPVLRKQKERITSLSAPRSLVGLQSNQGAIRLTKTEGRASIIYWVALAHLGLKAPCHFPDTDQLPTRRPIGHLNSEVTMDARMQLERKDHLTFYNLILCYDYNDHHDYDYTGTNVYISI